MKQLLVAAFVVVAVADGSRAWGEETSPPAPPHGASAVSDESAVEGRWVEVTPLRWGAEASLRGLGAGQEEIRIEDEELGPAMICSGGADSAIRCERGVVEEGGTLLVPPATGQTVTGRLLEGREVLAGVRVGVVPADLTIRRPFTVPLALERDGDEPSRSVVTDSRGRFHLPSLSAGEYLLELSLPGGRTERSEPFRVRDPAKAGGAPTESGGETISATLDLGDLELAPGLTVEFWAWSQDGEPVPDVQVGAFQGEGSSVRLFESRTGVDGRAAVSGFRPDEPVHASCSGPGYQRHEERFPRPPVEVDCWMVRLAAIEGAVEDEAGPLERFTVSLVARTGQPVVSERSAENGRFRFADLAPGEYRLVVAAPGYRWEELPLELAAGEQMQLDPLILLPATEVEGVVLDAFTGSPVAGATVAAVDPAGAMSETTDDEGRFEAPQPDEGELVVVVTAPGYARREASLAADTELGDEPWTVELEPGGRIRAVVWNEDGESPCAGCAVVVDQPGASTIFREGLRTSTEGVAETGLLPPGRYQVVLEEVQSLGSVVTVRSGDRLREAVVTNGQTTEVYFLPDKPLEIRFWPAPAAGWRLSARGHRARHALDPVAPGVFRVPRQPGESLELSLIRPGLTVGQGSVPADFRGDAWELSLPGTGVHGRLGAADGSLPTEVEIHAIPPGSGPAARVAVSGDGSFQVPFLRPGAYGLVAGGAWLTTFQTTEGETDLGTLELRSPATADSDE